MSPATKTAAVAKLHAILDKIGYPDQWRDYRSIDVARDDAVGNAFRSGIFEARRQLAKVGQPVDRKEWGMTPPTVNAYYSPQMNTINFPAGILQPPLFDPTMDDAVNLGGIGCVIGHELTHGFDDEGRKFDGSGNLHDWWTPEDRKAFDERASCTADQYSGYVATGDVHLDGHLTLGENTADAGGVRIAYLAMLDRLTKAGGGGQKVDGLTPDQRFFLSYASGWCRNMTDASLRLLATTDPHSPPRYRVNGVLSNMLEFQQAFGCKAGDKMVRESQCRVW
jgi:endothelin-converting enzyme/putative endopeptidase